MRQLLISPNVRRARSVITVGYGASMRSCAECGDRFIPSSRHLRCPSCRSRDQCPCGREKQAKSATCFTCRKSDGRLNGNWRGGRTKHKAGYIMIRLPDHPRSRGSVYVFEHILVMEDMLGRYLLPD